MYVNRTREASIIGGTGAFLTTVAFLIFPVAQANSDGDHNSSVAACEQALPASAATSTDIPGACLDYPVTYVDAPIADQTHTDGYIYGHIDTELDPKSGASYSTAEYYLPSATAFAHAHAIPRAEVAKHWADGIETTLIIGGIAVTLSTAVLELTAGRRRRNIHKQVIQFRSDIEAHVKEKAEQQRPLI